MREPGRNYSYSRDISYPDGYTPGYRKTNNNTRRIDKKRLHRMANQLIAACVLALSVIVTSNFNAPFARSIVSGAKWVAEENFDFKGETASFTNNVFPDISKKIKDAFSTLQGVFSGKSSVDTSTKTNSLMIWPVNGEVTSGFGEREDPITHQTVQHDGIDIAGKQGDPIKAALDGTVEKVGESSSLGLNVTIKHSSGIETVYGHCSEIIVKENQQVKQGDIIAKIGSTGESTGPHLHFEVLKDGKQVDPTTMISSVTESE